MQFSVQFNPTYKTSVDVITVNLQDYDIIIRNAELMYLLRILA